LSVAGHKLYAPPGVGALYVRAGTPIEPLLLGAGHERGLRPGTENVAAIAGLGQACAIAARNLAEETVRLSGLRDHLWNRLKEQIPALALNGHPVDRLPNTLNVRFPGVSGNAMLAQCPGVAASTGSACHEDKDSASFVILAMGIPHAEAAGSVRLTLGRGNNKAEIDQAADALIRAWRKLHQESVGRSNRFNRSTHLGSS
jgi:cysteine desulfurase